MITKGSYVHNTMVKFLGASQKCIFNFFANFSKCWWFQTKQLTKFFWIHKTLVKQNPLHFFFFTIYYWPSLDFKLSCADSLNFKLSCAELRQVSPSFLSQITCSIRVVLVSLASCFSLLAHDNSCRLCDSLCSPTCPAMIWQSWLQWRSLPPAPRLIALVPYQEICVSMIL